MALLQRAPRVSKGWRRSRRDLTFGKQTLPDACCCPQVFLRPGGPELRRHPGASGSFRRGCFRPRQGSWRVATGGAQRNPWLRIALDSDPSRRDGGGFLHPCRGEDLQMRSCPRVPLRSTRGYFPAPPSGRRPCTETLVDNSKPRRLVLVQNRLLVDGVYGGGHPWRNPEGCHHHLLIIWPSTRKRIYPSRRRAPRFPRKMVEGPRAACYDSLVAARRARRQVILPSCFGSTACRIVRASHLCVWLSS